MNAANVATIDDLPELPFQQIVSYLSFRDRINLRSVCRSWRMRFDFKANSLCCSDSPSGREFGGEFIDNYISSPEFHLFLITFAPTILADLKHLRLVDACLYGLLISKSGFRKTSRSTDPPVLIKTLSSFRQLERVEIINTQYYDRKNEKMELDLRLPVCTSLHLENVYVESVCVDAPALRKINLVNSEHCEEFKLDLIHGESVERLSIDGKIWIFMNGLKNLKYLDIIRAPQFNLSLLSRLEHLEEIHLQKARHVPELRHLFQQNPSLKVYRFGCLLNGPGDPLATDFQSFDDPGLLPHLAENLTRLVDEIPLFSVLEYWHIERVALEKAVCLLKRFTDLREILVHQPVPNAQRFLDLLKNLNITRLEFIGPQPQDLFDGLPEHSSTLQKLTIAGDPSNLRFLFRLKNLTVLHVPCLMDFEFILFLLKELKNLKELRFNYLKKMVRIRVGTYDLEKYSIFIDNHLESTTDLNVAIRYLVEKLTEKGWGGCVE